MKLTAIALAAIIVAALAVTLGFAATGGSSHPLAKVVVVAGYPDVEVKNLKPVGPQGNQLVYGDWCTLGYGRLTRVAIDGDSVLVRFKPLDSVEARDCPNGTIFLINKGDFEDLDTPQQIAAAVQRERQKLADEKQRIRDLLKQGR